jgi:hypothetical protein
MLVNGLTLWPKNATIVVGKKHGLLLVAIVRMVEDTRPIHFLSLLLDQSRRRVSTSKLDIYTKCEMHSRFFARLPD